MRGQCADQVAATVHRIENPGTRIVTAFGGLRRLVLVRAEHVGPSVHVQQQRRYQRWEFRQRLQAVATRRIGQQRQPVVIRHRAEERARQFERAESSQYIGVQLSGENSQRLLHGMPP